MEDQVNYPLLQNENTFQYMRIDGPMVALGEVCYWFKSVFRGTRHQSKNTIGTTETILS